MLALDTLEPEVPLTFEPIIIHIRLPPKSFSVAIVIFMVQMKTKDQGSSERESELTKVT